MSAKQLTETDPRPVDLSAMRATARRLLGPDDGPDILPPTVHEAEALTATPRGHLGLLAPEVEQVAGRLGNGSIPRYCALACVGEARGKLRAIDASGETPEEAAYRQLLEHCTTCERCRASNEAGENAGLPCEAGDRIYREYRNVRRGPAASPDAPAQDA
ncbi:DUF6415 family natural product biosynthesis protein [Streptomyces sp. NPDC002838]|uniref:DUF6415 family natural product biosynthesis protein n=1 Tax=Streptomyces sp. NPDC002838 TaxID=3154436 RepID=UPI003322EA27